MKIDVNARLISKLLNEKVTTPSMGWQSAGELGTAPVAVSAVVDPSAAVTDPGNEGFRPKNRAELKTALSAMIDNLSDDCAENIFDAMKKAIEDMAKEEDKEMIKKNDNKVEETIRRSVRKIISEMGPYRDTGLSYSGPMTGSAAMKPGFEECEACEGEGILDSGQDCKICKGKGAVPSKGRKNVMMTDVGGASFKEIAAEMGYASESGAKQAVEKALQKARFTATMDEDEMQILTLTAMNDYIKFLQGSGELTAADVQLMKDHPNIVSGLEGFREFLDKALARAQKSGQKVVNPVKD